MASAAVDTPPKEATEDHPAMSKADVVEAVGEEIETPPPVNVESLQLADGHGEEEEKEELTKSKQIRMTVAADAPWFSRMWEVFTTFWPLGLVAFGGPSAHVAIMREHLVVQRDWLDEDSFQDLYAIGQGLPGPTSTQLVVSTALSRAGPLGGLLAFFLWNLPGFVVLTVCGVLSDAYIDPENPPFWLVGLAPAAIALVFKSFYAMALPLDKLCVLLALWTCLVAILLNNDARIPPSSSQFMFPICLALGGLITFADSRRAKPFSTYKSPSSGWDRDNDEVTKRIGIPMWIGAVMFVTWAVVLVAVIVMVQVYGVTNAYLEIFEVMYRIGSIIYGGGEVVLPMLQDEVVPFWMTQDQFLQGLGIALSMPGPLFNFSAYLGAIYKGVPGAFVGQIGLFSPGVILIFAVVPFWARLRHNYTFKAILQGVSASAIGLVGAACVILWESAIVNASDAMIFSVALTMIVVFNVPAPLVVLSGGVIGAILHDVALNLGQVPYCIDYGFVYASDENEYVNTTDMNATAA